MNQSAEDAARLRTDVTKKAVVDLRKRLLDLSNRNRLLNYRHRDTARQVRLIDTSLTSINSAISTGNYLRFVGLPKDDDDDDEVLEEALAKARLIDDEFLAAIANADPDDDAAVNAADKRLEAKVREQMGLEGIGEKRSAAQVAQSLGMSTDFDLPVDSHENANLQTLLFEDALERKVSSIRDEALSSLQERGVNTLYCALGFLEWFESDDSKKVIHSPLILLPIEIDRKVEHGRYVFSAKGIGEDPEANVTLSERLYADFHLSIPNLDPEASVTDYLRLVEMAIASQGRWKIRTFATVGLFDFTRLAMYKDLDPQRRPDAAALETHPVVLDLLGGVAETSPGSSSDSWSDDVHHSTAPVLITDADSSQFAAILEALGGRSFVIEGPPGTGKSQTITNLIAACLAAGKRVLFVADKLAALQVVKNRLDAAGLGDFCLELHSTKARKSDVYASLQKRLYSSVQSPVYKHAEILSEIAQHKEIIANYCESLHTVVGSLGNSAFDLIWRGQRLGMKLGDATQKLQVVNITAPMSVRRRDLADAKSLLANVAERERSYAMLYGSVELHPLAAITATSLDQSRIAELKEILATIVHLAALIPRRLGDLGIGVGDEPLTFGLFSDVVNCIYAARKLEALPNHVDVQFAAHAEDREMLLDVGKHLYADVLTRENYPRELYLRVVANPERFGSLLQRLEDTGLTKLADIQTAIEDANESLRRLRSARDCIDALNRVLPWDLSTSRPAIDTLVGVVSAVGRADRRVLQNHEGTLVRTAPAAVIADAEARAAEVRDALERQRMRFDLSLIEDTATLRRLAATLREAGFFTALVSSAVRDAKRHYRRLSLKYERANRNTIASQYVELAGAVEAAKQFENDGRLRDILGTAFCGLATDFEFLQSVAAVAADIREQLALHGEPGIELERRMVSLGVGDFTALHAIASTGAFEALRDFCSTVSTSTALSDKISSIEANIRDLETTAALWNEFMPPPDLPLRRLLNLADQVASSTEHKTRLAASLEASEFFTDPESADEITSKLLALRYFELLADGNLTGLLLELDPIVIVSSEQSQELSSLYEALTSALDRLSAATVMDVEAFTRGPINEALVLAMRDSAESMLQHLTDIPDWLQYRRALKSVREQGLDDILEVCSDTGADPGDAFEYALVRRILLQTFDESNHLADVVGSDLAEARTGFQSADRRLLRANQIRLRNDLVRRHVDPGNRTGNRGSWSGMALIENEARKSRKHISIRELVKRSGEALQQLKPCFMMSPLSVAQYIDPQAAQFDLLIVDEASQMRPEDALGAVSRAGQFVVVGDPKQLPPTTFFDRVEQNDEVPDEDAIETESILDLAMQQYGKPRRLIWHYRSRHDSLIAFSNKHFYDDELQVFPSPDQSGDLGVRSQYAGDRYHGSVNPGEAVRVAERALEIMKNEPKYSLGIVAINQPQRDLIRLEIERRLVIDTAGQRYVDQWEDRLEPFIIKNLESIQGDERDVMLISTVYGRDAAGNVFQRFGPINSRTGWRRLNVLFTRAKSRVEVITSLRASDIIVDERTSRGARALRDYLEYASSGRLESGVLTGRPPDSDFEIAVSELLKMRGYECVPEVGVAGFFVDIGVLDPENSSRFILGIECDGSTYHSSKAARDRDRLKDEVLARLGWRLHRIWSTDWFSDSAREIDRAIAAIESERARQKQSEEGSDEPVESATASPGPSRGISVKARPTAEPSSAEAQPPKVDELLLESDILKLLREILPTGSTMEREKLLRSVSAALKSPLTRRLRSTINTMLSKEVRSGRLRVNASWSIVRRP